MKKLNRRQIRSVLLKELRSINEETGPDALQNFLHKQDDEYKRVAKQDGVIAMAFAMLIGLPTEAMVGGGKLLADDTFRAELEAKYNEEGLEQAYVHWINSLSKATGL